MRTDETIRFNVMMTKSADLKRRIATELADTVIDVVDACETSLRGGGKLLFCGNGGSAADSQHLATEMLIRLRGSCERPSIAALALTLDPAMLTACGNDYGYDRVFERPLRGLGRRGDVLFGITTSGRSGNVIKALEAAREMGIVTVGMLGGSGEPALSLCDLSLVVPDAETARIQECHIALGPCSPGTARGSHRREADVVKVLVTGCAGFIGYHVTQALLARGDSVLGLDSLNDYYDVRLKQARLDRLRPHSAFQFHHLDVSDKDAVSGLTADHGDVSGIVHLAAQAGVRYSLVDPYAYVQANVMGHLVVLEAARRLPGLRHLVYASTSSVYGANTTMPFRETDRVDQPVSLYAATKRADELISHAYGHLFGLPQTGLRFFTVYGPWGRPDMAYFSFAQAITAGEPITLYNEGRLKRDFTYIDDIVAGIVGSLDRPPVDTCTPRLLNIGNHRVEEVRELVRLLEAALGQEAIIKFAPRPSVDVEATFASIDAIGALTGFAPTTPLAVGIPRFVAWFKEWRRG